MAEIGYTLGLAGIVGLWLWMLLTPGKWEQTMSEGQKLWGRFEPLFSQFLAKRIVGWALVAVIGSNVIVRTVGHLT